MSASYAAAPGMYLQEWIEEASLTQQEAADRLGLSRKTVNGIIKGTQPVSQETAIKLERITSIPRDAWLRFEAKYRAGLARLEDEKKRRAFCVDHPGRARIFYARSRNNRRNEEKPRQARLRLPCHDRLRKRQGVRVRCRGYALVGRHP